MPLSHKDVAEIIKLLDASTLDEFAIDLPDLKLVVRRRGASDASIAVSEVNPISISAPPAETAPRPPVAPRARTDGAVEIRAPMVGTFYRSPSPKDPPFVEVGDMIQSGQSLGLIEVMKLYTTIEAKQAGRIADIPAVSGALVEYDQVLFVIAPV